MCLYIYILDKFVPDGYTLKYKSYIEKLIISSHGMSISCEGSGSIEFI